jgi:hypothetical protein
VESYIQSNERNLELFNFCEFLKENLGLLVNFHEQKGFVKEKVYLLRCLVTPKGSIK